MQRFYLPDTELSGEIVIFDKDIVHQITKVIRLRFGESVIFFDGKSQKDAIYTFHSLKNKSLFFRLQETFKKRSELGMQLCLYQALPNKLEKLEYIVQKCSEIGFSKIVFFYSERSQKLLLSENKKQRLQKIMQEAIEQCGRNILCDVIFDPLEKGGWRGILIQQIKNLYYLIDSCLRRTCPQLDWGNDKISSTSFFIRKKISNQSI